VLQKKAPWRALTPPAEITDSFSEKTATAPSSDGIFVGKLLVYVTSAVV